MDVLNQMVMLMDRKEVKNFKIYMGRVTESEDRKDLTLFDMIRKTGDKYDDDKAFSKLYKDEDDKNAFYRLKNRLIEDINKSIFMQEFHSDNAMLSFYLAALGHYYFSKTEYRLAFYHYKKAEKKAQELEDYGLLDIIYARMIRISQELLTVNPEDYIRKRRENRNLLNKLSELHDVLEAVEYRMKLSQNLSASKSINNLLKITIDDFARTDELKESSRLQFGIYRVVSRVLLQNNDFPKLEEYLVQAYSDFVKKEFFNKNNHDTKLEMLSWIANSLFKNKKYQASLDYAEVLKTEMERFDKMLYERFELFYYNILIINFSAVNNSKAIEILLSLTQREKIIKQPIYGAFVYSNLAVLYYQSKEYKKALKYINELIHFEGYRTMDDLVKLKLALGELMIRYELKERDVLEYRFKQISKDFSETLDRPEILWEKSFMDVVQILITDDHYKKNTTFKSTVHIFLEKTENLEGTDEMLFMYDTWVKEKANL